MGQQLQVSVLFLTEYNTLQSACPAEGYSTRNSAIADKPRDAFVQYTTVWLTPPPQKKKKKKKKTPLRRIYSF